MKLDVYFEYKALRFVRQEVNSNFLRNFDSFMLQQWTPLLTLLTKRNILIPEFCTIYPYYNSRLT